MCTVPQALAWMTGAVEAPCADPDAAGGAYPEFVYSKEVLPNPSSPPMTVHIHRKKLPCHCHSYEKIECNAPGTANALYDEHINEITEHCAGVLDGTITDCPYKCFPADKHVGQGTLTGHRFELGALDGCLGSQEKPLRAQLLDLEFRTLRLEERHRLGAERRQTISVDDAR